MMNKEILNYNWEQLLDNEQFINWIVRNENRQEWEKLLDSNHVFAVEVKKARQALNLLQDKYDVLDDNSVRSVWNKIEAFYDESQTHVRKIKLKKTFGWAASILLLISIGVAGYYFTVHETAYEFAASGQVNEGEAYLLLSSGERIGLAEEKSTIRIDDAELNIIINDTIISTNRLQTSKIKTELNEVVIPYGRQSKITLADGTVVWLNAGSKLAFPSEFSTNNRAVHLEGEAAFQVAKNESKPFIVRIGEGLNVRVRGTFFNVSAYPEQAMVETVLINGRIEINQPGLFNSFSVELTPNEKAEFNKKSRELKVTYEPDAKIYIAWVNGWLEYNKESLNSVLIKLERYYDVKFHLPSDFPADDKISGKLDLRESFENILQVLADAAQVEYKIKGQEIYIQNKDRK